MKTWVSCFLVILLGAEIAIAATGSTASDVWYARPSGACANNGDGLAYGCAASNGATGAFIGFSNLIWTDEVGIDDGDTLYVCGSHTTSLAVSSSASGTHSSPIVIDFRCPDDTGSITRVTTMSEALTAGSWTNESGSLWYLSVAGYTYRNPKRLWLDSVEIFPSSVKANLGTQEGSGAPLAQFWYDSGNNRIYLYASANPATTMTSMQSLVADNATCSYTALCLNADANDYFTIINPNLSGGNLASMYLLGADHVTIYGTLADDSACLIGSNGQRGILVADVSTAGTGDPASFITVRDCTIDANAPATFVGYNWQWNQGNGDGLAVVYGVQSSTFDSNTVRNWGHANINHAATLGTNANIGNTFSRNTLTYTTVEYGRCFAFDGSTIGQSTGNQFIGNDCNGQPIRSQLNGDGNTVAGNIFRNQRASTVSPTAAQSLDLEGYAGPSQGNYIVNNVFSNNAYGPCLSFRAGGNTKSDYVVANNILVDCGGTAVSGAENIALYIQDAASVGSQTFYNNAISKTGVSNSVHYKATGATTVSGFQSACSGDVCSGTVTTAPSFLSAGSFQLSLSSGLRSAGRSIRGCLDYRLRACPPNAPHIGAYQSTSGDPAATRAVRN